MLLFLLVDWAAGFALLLLLVVVVVDVAAPRVYAGFGVEAGLAAGELAKVVAVLLGWALSAEARRRTRLPLSPNDALRGRSADVIMRVMVIVRWALGRVEDG